MTDVNVSNLEDWKRVLKDNIIWIERQNSDINVSAFFIYFLNVIRLNIAASPYTLQPMKFPKRRLKWLGTIAQTLNINGYLGGNLAVAYGTHQFQLFFLVLLVHIVAKKIDMVIL